MVKKKKNQHQDKRISGTMNDEVRKYIRYHPRWFVILSRYPEKASEVVEIYKEENNQTFSAKIEQLSMILNMMEMML